MGVVGGSMSPECACLCLFVLSHLKGRVKSEGHWAAGAPGHDHPWENLSVVVGQKSQVVTA